MAYEDQLSENTIVPTVSEMTQQAVKYLQVLPTILVPSLRKLNLVVLHVNDAAARIRLVESVSKVQLFYICTNYRTD
jgi:hypothetical protein